MHTTPPQEHLTGDAPALTVVLAHGRGGSPGRMRELATRVGLSDVRYLLLQADDATWYPDRFVAPFADNEPWLSAAIAHLEGVVADLIASGAPADRIAVGGFSQGACLTAEWLARPPRRLAAAFVLTGGLIGPEGTTWPTRAALSGMPVYQTSALDDPWIPPERARETARWFERSGADLTLRLFDSREHLISDEEVASIRDTLAPLRR